MKDTAQKMQTPELPDLPAQEFGAVCTHALSLIDQNREYLQMHFSGRGDERAETALSDIEVETVRLERALAGMLRLWEVSGGISAACWVPLKRWKSRCSVSLA